MTHNKNLLKGNYYHTYYLEFTLLLFGFLVMCYILISHTIPNFNTLSYSEIAPTILVILGIVIALTLKLSDIINTTTQIRLTENGFYILFKLKKGDKTVLLNNIEQLRLKISLGNENHRCFDDDVKIFLKNDRYPIQFGSTLLTKKDWISFIEYLIKHKVNYIDKEKYLETYRKHYG